MKYYLILFFLSVFSHSANCQIDKGYWLAGGSGNLYFYNENYTATDQRTLYGKLTEINLSGNIGYFVLDKFAIGLRPGIKSIKSKGLNTGSVGTKEISLYIGPFARYYFLNVEKPFNILLDASYQMGSYTTFIGKGTRQIFTGMVGPEVFFNSAVGIELLLGYMYDSRSIHGEPLSFDHKRNGLQMSIGFQFHLIND